jgi:hypothetical protein
MFVEEAPDGMNCQSVCLVVCTSMSSSIDVSVMILMLNCVNE